MRRADLRCTAARGAAAVALLLALAAPPPAAAGEVAPAGPPAERIVHVPAAEWEAVLARAEGGVLLSWDEYRELWRAARAGAGRAAPDAPPAAALLVTAALSGAPDGDRLALRLIGRVHVLAPDGWAACPLGAPGLAFGAARLDGQPALLAPDDAGAVPPGGTRLFLRGPGWHTLEAEVGVPIRPDGIRRVAHLVTPRAAAQRLEVTLPGDVAVQVEGAPAQVAAIPGGTVVRLYPAPDAALTLAWEPRGGAADAPTAAEVDEAVSVSVAEGRLTLSSRLRLTLHGAPAAALSVALPPGLVVMTVEADGLASWDVEGDVEGRGERRRLVLRPATPRSGTWTVTVAGEQEVPTPGRFAVPHLAVEGAVVHEGRLVLRARAELDLRPLPAPRFVPVPLSADAADAEPPAAGPAPLPPRRAFAWTGADATLEAEVAPVAAQVIVDVATAVSIREEALALTAVLAVGPRRGSVHALEVVLPEGWRPLDVREDGEPLAWDHAPGGDVLTVRLPAAVRAGERALVEVRAEHVPEGWLGEEWETRELRLPLVLARGNSLRVRGHVGVAAAAAFEVSDTDLVGLTRKDIGALAALGITGPELRLGYRFEGVDARATLRVRREPTRVATAVTTVARIDRGLLRVHAEVRYAVEGTGLRDLRLRLPAAHARKARFAIPDGPVIQQQIPPAEPAPGAPPADGAVWQLVLQGRARGVFHVIVDFDQPLAPGTAEIAVPRVAALHEGRHEATYIVEAGPDLEVTAHPDGLAELDLGEVPPFADYRPRHRLVSAWRAVRDDARLPLSLVTHEEVAVLPVYVAAADAVSVLGRGGALRTRVEYRLKNTRAQYLPLVLPEGAALWSVHVGGEPRKPVRVGEAVWIPLVAGSEAADALVVRLVYESPAAALGALVRRDLALPRLPETPVGRTAWRVLVPDGYQVLAHDGLLDGPAPARERPFLLAALGFFGDACRGPSCSRHARRAEQEARAPAPTSAASPADDFGGWAPPGGTDEVGRPQESEKAEAAKEDPAWEVQTREEAREQAPPRDAAKPTDPALLATPAAAIDFEVGAQTAEPPAPDRAEGTAARAAGLLSLDVELVTTGNEWIFERLGGDGALALTLLDGAARGTLRRLVGVLAFVLGLVLLRRRLRPGAFLLLAVVVPTVVGLVAPSWAVFANPLGVGACLAWLAVVVWRRRARRHPADAGVPGRAAAAAAGGAAALVVLLGSAPTAWADPIGAPDGGAPVTVFAPWTGDGKLPGGAPPARVWVPQDLFDQLWRAAQPQPAAAAPATGAVLSDARYELTLRGRRLTLRARFTVAALSDGWVRLPLPFGSAVVESARLDGAVVESARLDGAVVESARLDGAAIASERRDGALVALAPGDGGPTLLLRGPSPARTLAIEAALPFDGESRRGSAPLVLPPSAVARLVVTLPGDDLDVVVEAAGAKPVATSRRRQGSATLLEADIGGAGALALRWAPAALRAAGADAALHVETVLVARFGRGGARIEQSLRVAPRDGAAAALRLTLPPGVRALDLRGPAVGSWRVAEDGASLTVLLREPQDRPFVVQLRAFAPLRTAGAPLPTGDAPLALAAAQVEGAVRQADVVVLTAPPELRLRPGSGAGLVRAGAAEVRWPEGTPPPPDELLAGAQIFTAARAGWSLPVAVVAAPGGVAAEVRTALVLNRTELYGWTEARLRPEGNGPLGVALDLPADLLVTSVEWAAGDDGLLDWRMNGPAAPGAGRVRLELDLARPVRDGDAVVLLLEGRPADPAAVALPVVHVPGAVAERGAVAVAVEPGLTVRVAALDGLESAAPTALGGWVQALTDQAPALAFTWTKTSATTAESVQTATLRLEDTPLRLAVAVRTDVVVEDDALRVTEQLDYEVLQGVARDVAVVVPPALADRVRLESAAVRDRDVLPGPDGSAVWAVRLHAAEAGRFGLTFRWELPLARGERLAVPHVVPQGTGRLRRDVVVHNASRGEVAAEAGPGLEAQPLDGSAAAGAGTAVARFRAEGGEGALTVGVRELAAESILEASVDFAELTTVVGRDGLARTRAAYRLQNRSEQYLRLRLPEGVAVWGATVAGSGVRPARGTDEAGPLVLVPLVRTGAGDLAFEVVLVYAEDLGGPLGWTQTIEPAAPEVVGIPVTHTIWHLWLPDGFEPGDFDANLEEVLDVAGERLKLATRQEELRRLDRTISTGNEQERQVALDNLNKLADEYNRDVTRLETLQQEVLAPDNPLYTRYSGKKVRDEASALSSLLNKEEASGFGNFTILDGRLQVNPQAATQAAAGDGLDQTGRGEAGQQALWSERLQRLDVLPQGNLPDLGLLNAPPTVSLDAEQMQFNTLVTKRREARADEGEYRRRTRKGKAKPDSQLLDGLVDLARDGLGQGVRGAGPGAAAAVGGLDPSGGAVGPPAAGALVALPLAGVHSLDIELPTAGTDHHLSKLGGGARLQVRLTRQGTGGRVGAWGAALALLLVTGWALPRLQRGPRRAAARQTAA
jgi:uncharacterized protein YjbI with pentapeptide repeats